MIDNGQETWNEDRLQGLIDYRIEEGPELDYKCAAALGRSEAKKSEITKDVSAFANSTGGTLIYGIREFDDPERKHLPQLIDPVDGREFSREWLDQIIGQISPRIPGIRITPVRVGNELWHVCYVVEVPKALTAHQARDLRYYRRYNFESVPMADYEIRDVMSRRDHPVVEYRLHMTNTLYTTCKIMVRIWNKGHVIVSHYKIRVLVPTVIQNMNLFRDGLILQEADGFKFWRQSVGNGNLHPLFPQDDVIHDIELPFTPRGGAPLPTADYLHCTLYADSSPSIVRKVPVSTALEDWA